MRLFCIGIAVLAMAACAPFPDFDGTPPPGTEDQDYPALTPLEPVLAKAGTPTPDAQQTQDTLQARIAALNRKADALRKRTAD